MEKIKQFIVKKKQLILYLGFGLLTTVISLLAWYLTLKFGVLIWHDENGDPTPFLDVLGSTSQWIFGVLSAFVSNKLWVFTDAEHGVRTTFRQLAVFAGSRILTYFMEIGLNLFAIFTLEALALPAFSLTLFGLSLTFDARFWAKMFSSVFVVIANYFISKLLVFRQKKPLSK